MYFLLLNPNEEATQKEKEPTAKERDGVSDQGENFFSGVNLQQAEREHSELQLKFL